MEGANGSDLSKTELDLVDLSAAEQSQNVPVEAFSVVDDNSLHPMAMATKATKGFCVKEFEEQLQGLKKENFNLKLRIYFLEERNPNVPAGDENLYKDNIDLRVRAEN